MTCNQKKKKKKKGRRQGPRTEVDCLKEKDLTLSQAIKFRRLGYPTLD